MCCEFVEEVIVGSLPNRHKNKSMGPKRLETLTQGTMTSEENCCQRETAAESVLTSNNKKQELQ